MPEAPLPRCFALVPCAGTGARSGAALPKQYLPIAGKPVIAHTLEALSRVPRLALTLVVLSRDDDAFEAAVHGFSNARGRVARCGGTTRAESVSNGLESLAAHGARERDWVLVHDAARCLVRPQWIERLLDACWADEVGGLLALPLADTLKQAQAGRVAATLDRRDKWVAQTPQMFRLGLLRQALASSGPGVTDEASAVEALGHAPLLVTGELENFKLTYPGDFDLAQRLLGACR